MLAIQFFVLIAVAIAIIAMIVKALRYATAPESMRWELYPVPHEKGRAEYGGSYLEELDWWTKPRHSDKLNELREMFSEIVLLKGVRHHNKRVWRSSFPFHFGLYLTIGWLVLLLLGGILQKAGVPVSAHSGGIGEIVHWLTIPVGYAGLGLAALGALGLFVWRATDDFQKRYNAPIDYFNLVVVMVTCGFAFFVQATVDPTMAAMRAFVGSTVTLSMAGVPSTLFAIEVVLIAFTVAWITLTRMSHFVAKYFLYHAVRWNDTPNERGSKIEKTLVKALSRKVSWSAAHIQTGKSWGEVVTATEVDKDE